MSLLPKSLNGRVETDQGRRDAAHTQRNRPAPHTPARPHSPIIRSVTETDFDSDPLSDPSDAEMQEFENHPLVDKEALSKVKLMAGKLGFGEAEGLCQSPSTLRRSQLLLVRRNTSWKEEIRKHE